MCSQQAQRHAQPCRCMRWPAPHPGPAALLAAWRPGLADAAAGPAAIHACRRVSPGERRRAYAERGGRAGRTELAPPRDRYNGGRYPHCHLDAAPRRLKAQRGSLLDLHKQGGGADPLRPVSRASTCLLIPAVCLPRRCGRRSRPPRVTHAAVLASSGGAAQAAPATRSMRTTGVQRRLASARARSFASKVWRPSALSLNSHSAHSASWASWIATMA